MTEAVLDITQVRRWKRYGGFETTRVDWIEQHPSDWIGIPVKRWVETPVTDGPHETPEIVSEGIEFVSAEAMKDGKIDFDSRRGYISPAIHEIYCRKLRPQRDDIFICKSGATTGKIAMVDTDREFSVWSPLALVRVDRERMCPRFMFWGLQADYVQNQIRRTWSEGTQPNISMASIERLFVVGPRVVEEQRAIAAFLDRETVRIDALIGHKERLIALLEEKRQAVISHAVTRGLDPNVKMKDSGSPWIGDVPDHWGVAAFKRATTRVVVGIAEAATHAYADDGVPIVRSMNVRPNRLITDDLLYIQPWFAEQNQSKYLLAGDLVTVRTGYPGTTAVVPESLHMCQCFTLLISTLQTEHNSDYFSYVLNSSPSRAYFEVEGWGSAQLNISVPILQFLPVPIPPPEEQAKIVEHLQERLDRLDSVASRIRDGVDRLKEYRTALISAAVTGQIDVRDEVPER